ncbi:hypothetical protein OIV83_005253 [Microbotryomycetes sp. JL201]|nr:hypothetical protein OIV83_005253 [Microbotryomycetes sp. JL201]
MSDDEKGGTVMAHIATAQPAERDESSELPYTDLQFFKSFKWRIPALYMVFLVFWNIVVPCLLFYALDFRQCLGESASAPQSTREADTDTSTVTGMDDATIIGISSAALGISSFIDMPIRLFKLIRRGERYAPPDVNGQRHEWYYLDATMMACAWILGFFAVPLSVAPAIPTYPFFLFSFGMLVLAAVIAAVVSLKSFKLPIKLSSQPRGAMSRPLAFYVVEDVVAVDFGRGKPYETSPVFQQSMHNQTAMWAASGSVFVGASAAVAWTVPLVIAFALNLCLFFIWLGATMLIAWKLAKRDLKREHEWWNAKKPVAA